MPGSGAARTAARLARTWRRALAEVDDDDETLPGRGVPHGRARAAAPHGESPDELTAPPLHNGLPRGRRYPCLTAPVQAHLRRLAVGIAGSGSYAPGSDVPLAVASDADAVSVGLVDDDMSTEVVPGRDLDPRVAHLQLPAWLHPGLYRIKVTGPGDVHRFVPLVVRSTEPVDVPLPDTTLVVWPYLTWRAYNRFDGDRDGMPDTWYQNWNRRDVTLAGAYEVGPAVDGRRWRGRCTTLGRLHGLGALAPAPRAAHHRRRARPPAAVDAAALSRDRVSGHTEYYEDATYWLVRSYRDAGGHLLFLSSNDFFRTVTLDPAGNRVTLTDVLARYDDRSDYALVGVGFSCCVASGQTYPYRTSAAGFTQAPWAFAGTGLAPDMPFGNTGREIDQVDPLLSPPGLVRLAVANSSPARHPAACGDGADPGRGGHGVRDRQHELREHAQRHHPSSSAQARRLLDNAWTRLAES